MEKLEFYLFDGKVCWREDGTERILTQSNRDIITYVLDALERYFPETLEALNDECQASSRNKMYYDFRRVELFIRCNFSEHDTMHFDIDRGLMHFEEVKCPRRGICKHEGVICKPKLSMPLSGEEGKVAALYSKGLGAKEIARVLKKSIKTVKNQLNSARKRLKLNRTKDLIRVFAVYNAFTQI